MRFSTLLFLIISFSALSQERRLALVIGNSNYEKGPLQNPVNDALLMKKTLEDLDFDVILDTNIATFSDFKNAIRVYGDSRDKYNVGFIYYAGHAVQINDVNYLLATKENYLSELDVEFNALSVQYIMRFLTSRTDDVNVLMLDACRDNPFEQNWNPTARSTEGGRGLARIAPPTGSLVAYSTDAGNTAADGNGKNSIYCLSLTKNMIIENVTLDQVFRNVRADVLESSSGRQRPVEASQLTGDAFYLKKSTFTDQIIEIDSLIDVENYSLAREKTSSILTLDPNNKQALLRKGRIEYNTIGQDYDGKELNKAAELYKNDPEIHEYLARFYSTIGKQEEALTQINLAIKLDSNYAHYYHWKAMINEKLEFYEDAIRDYTKAIYLEPNNALRYNARGTLYLFGIGDTLKALKDYSKAIELEPTNIQYLMHRADLYDNYLNQNIFALEDYQKILNLEPANLKSINLIGTIYQELDKPEFALAEYEKCIALEYTDNVSAASCRLNRSILYTDLGELDKALIDLNKAVELDPTDPELFNARADFFLIKKEDYTNALINYSAAIGLEPSNQFYLHNRAYLYDNYLNDNSKALEDLEGILSKNPSDVYAINTIGTIYKEMGKPELAIKQYEMGIALEKTDAKAAAYCYYNRSAILEEDNLLEKAQEDLTKAIILDPDNPEWYSERCRFLVLYKEAYKEALIDVTKAIELSPESVNYYFERAEIYNDYFKKPQKALEDYERMLKIDPGNVDAINSIGLIYEEMKKPELALAQYEKGISLEKTQPISAAYCYNNRAELYSRNGQINEAQKDYNKAIELDPSNSYRYSSRGLFYQDYKQDYNSALLDFSKAIELEPYNIEHLYNLGYLSQNYLFDYEKARTNFEEILKLDSNHVSSINSLGTLFDDEGKFELAISQYERGIDLKESDPQAAAYCYRNRAVIYSNNDRFDESLRDYTCAIEIDPENGEWYADRGVFFIEYLNNPTKALEDYNMAILKDPDNANYYLYRSKIQHDLKDFKSQEKDLNHLIKIESQSPEYYLERGMFYTIQGQFEKAEKDFNKCHLLDTTNHNIHFYWFKYYFHKDDLVNAMNALEKVRKMDPKDPEIYFNLGKIFEKQGKYIHATKNYSMAIGLLGYGDYYLTDDNAVIIEKAGVHFIIGQFYEKINELELMCEEYGKTVESLKDDNRYKVKEMKKMMEQKIQQNCN